MKSWKVKAWMTYVPSWHSSKHGMTDVILTRADDEAVDHLVRVIGAGNTQLVTDIFSSHFKDAFARLECTLTNARHFKKELEPDLQRVAHKAFEEILNRGQLPHNLSLAMEVALGYISDSEHLPDEDRFDYSSLNITFITREKVNQKPWQAAR